MEGGPLLGGLDWGSPRLSRRVDVCHLVGAAVSLPLPTKLLLTSEEAAEYCGVSVNSFKAHVPVPPVKIGGSVRYDRRALDRWAARQGTTEPLTGDDWLGRLDEGEGVGA